MKNLQISLRTVGFLKKSDWSELNHTAFVEIRYKNNNISLDYLFSDAIEEEVE